MNVPHKAVNDGQHWTELNIQKHRLSKHKIKIFKTLNSASSPIYHYMYIHNHYKILHDICCIAFFGDIKGVAML